MPSHAETTRRRSALVAGFALLATGLLAQSPGANAAEAFYEPLDAPQRLVDTREGFATVDDELAGIGIRAADSELQVRVAGRAGVAPDADAVVLNVTAVDALAPGFLTVYPCGEQRPWASNLNYEAGGIVANAVVARLSEGGDICIYTLSATHIVVDVAGFLPTGTFSPLATPQRLLDTRAEGPTADSQFSGVGQRPAMSTFALRVAGRAGVAPDAAVVVLNVTAVDAVGPGYLTVYPCGAPQPLASNLNFYPGGIVANLVVANVGTNGDVCIYTHAATDVVVDVTGAVPATTYAGLAAPQRLLDTRPGGATADGQLGGTGLLPADSSFQLRVGGRVNVPLDARAVVLNVTAVDPTGPGFLTVFPTGADRPNASNLNYTTGRIVPNTVIARLGSDGSTCIYSMAATHLVVDVAGFLTGPSVADGTPGCAGVTTVGSTALDVLATIPVAAEQPAGYSLTLFPWVDHDGDGCAADEVVLARDSLEPPVLNVHCEPVTGLWYSPYDGLTWTQASEVTVDHVVSLKEAWDSGAYAWSSERRIAFANDVDDRRTLRVVTDAIDTTKQTNDPQNWMPPLESDWCRYLGDYIAIKARWALTMDQGEVDDIREMLVARCPDLRIAAWPAAPQ